MPVEVAARLPVTVVAASPKVRPAECVVRLPVVPSAFRVVTAVRSVAPVARWAVSVLASLMAVVPPATVRAPPKSLAVVFSVTEPVPALTLVVPVTYRAAFCVTAPLAMTSRLPPKVPPASIRALASVTAALFVPLLLSVTVPVKSLAWVSVIGFAPALKVAAPAPVA